MLIGLDLSAAFDTVCLLLRGGVCIFKVFNEYPLNFGSDCMSMFSVKRTFGKTSTKQFCNFLLQKSALFGYKMCKYSNINLNTFAHSATEAVGLHSDSSKLVGLPPKCTLTCCYALQAAAAERATLFKLSFEYLHIYRPKSAYFFLKRQQNCFFNVLSKVRFAENIENIALQR